MPPRSSDQLSSPRAMSIVVSGVASIWSKSLLHFSLEEEVEGGSSSDPVHGGGQHPWRDELGVGMSWPLKVKPVTAGPTPTPIGEQVETGSEKPLRKMYPGAPVGEVVAVDEQPGRPHRPGRAGGGAEAELAVTDIGRSTSRPSRRTRTSRGQPRWRGRRRARAPARVDGVERELSGEVAAVPQRRGPRRTSIHGSRLGDREEGAGEEEERDHAQPEEQRERASFFRPARTRRSGWRRRARPGTARGRPVNAPQTVA